MPQTAAASPAHRPSAAARRLAWALLFVFPAMFGANQIAARWAADVAPPHFLALGRWALAAAILLPFVGAELLRHRHTLLAAWPRLLVQGALGMWVCGAFVYIGGKTTTATNIGLIYAASPVGIIALSRIFLGERMGARQLLGVAVCVAGVLTVIAKGDPRAFSELRFTVGDLWIATAAFCWSIYTVLLRRWPSPVGGAAQLCAIALGGVVVLIPFTAWEWIAVQAPVFDLRTILTVVVLAVVPGVGAYWTYGYAMRTLGAGPTGVGMYIGPLYTAAMAWLLLGEELRLYHLAGALLVLPGVWLATRPARPS